MNCSLFTRGFALVLLVLTPAMAEPPKGEPEIVIPLDRIWAYNMPGTRLMADAMRGRPPKYVSAEGPLLREILHSLSRRDATKGAECCFAVLGTDMEALQNAHAVLVEKEESRTSFPSKSDISVVFFSCALGSHVRIESANRRGNVVEIEYRSVSNPLLTVSPKFALIPLGRLPVGKISVSIDPPAEEANRIGQQLSAEERKLHRRMGTRICQSFCFSVVDDSDHPSNSKSSE